MKYRCLVYALVVTICPLLAHGQSGKETSFKTALNTIIQKLNSRDSAGLSKYIDPATGVYLLHRVGTQDHYEYYKTIGFSDTSYPHILYRRKVKSNPLTYGRLPEYDCAKNRWSKSGSFTDTTLIDHLLTKTALDLKRNQNLPISQATINEMTLLETVSRKVVIADNNGNDLVIFLSYINNKWMLSIIDTLSSDCSV